MQINVRKLESIERCANAFVHSIAVEFTTIEKLLTECIFCMRICAYYIHFYSVFRCFACAQEIGQLACMIEFGFVNSVWRFGSRLHSCVYWICVLWVSLRSSAQRVKLCEEHINAQIHVYALFYFFFFYSLLRRMCVCVSQSKCMLLLFFLRYHSCSLSERVLIRCIRHKETHVTKRRGKKNSHYETQTHSHTHTWTKLKAHTKKYYFPSIDLL